MQNKLKAATPDHPIHALIADRWSPYAFDRREVERDKLLSCLEAARWAASSYNEQPWSLIIATRDNPPAFATMLECLLEANQAWAAHAGVLMLTVTARSFTRNAKPNRMAEHDVGLAVGNLTVQATSLGLHVHQMAGINPSRARQTYVIPESHDPLTAVAIGYAADSQTEDALAERDRAPRTRKPLGEFVFSGVWGTPGV
jgi:nitroreductase